MSDKRIQQVSLSTGIYDLDVMITLDEIDEICETGLIIIDDNNINEVKF